MRVVEMTDEELQVKNPNRYIHKRLADPDGRYFVIAARDLERLKALTKELGIYEEFRALDVTVVPYEMDIGRLRE